MRSPFPADAARSSETVRASGAVRAAPLSVQVQMRFEDVTPAQHVGNAAILNLIEEARNRLVVYGGEEPDGTRAGGLLVCGGEGRPYLVAQQTVEYPAEVFYSPEPLWFGFWVGHIGRTSFTLDAEIRAEPAGPVLVRTESVIVLAEEGYGGAVPIDDVLRARLERYRAEPVELRPRPGVVAAAGGAR